MFFFYSVTDVISNVAKYNTSVKIYLSKSKITHFKNYWKKLQSTQKNDSITVTWVNVIRYFTPLQMTYVTAETGESVITSPF